jgi:hypothetical protein
VLGFSQNAGTYRTDAFAVSYPTGWTVMDIPGLEYKVIYGKSDDGFAPNIVFGDENYNSSLKEYVNLSIENTKLVTRNYRLLSRSAFKTDAGLMGERTVSLSDTADGTTLRQLCYYFGGSHSIKYLLVCSSSLNSIQQYDNIFDVIVRTFEIIGG